MTPRKIAAEAARDEWRVVRCPVIAAIVFLLAVTLQIPQRVEGALWPVIVGTDITKTHEAGDETLFYGRATQVRSCGFDRMEWFLDDGHNFSRVDVTMLETGKIRRPGGFAFGPWSVRLSRADLRQRTYAIVYHRCHPLWLTATKFYP